MKSIHLKTRLPAQADLFDSGASLPSLTNLQLPHEELVELLSQLLWQVAQDADAIRGQEDEDEQDPS
jgi:hypothetical protein